MSLRQFFGRPRANGGVGINPIEQFRNSLQEVSESKLPAQDKSKRMTAVNRAIVHYLHRVEAQSYSPKSQGAIDQAKSQLRDLASQANRLAEIYKQQG